MTALSPVQSREESEEPPLPFTGNYILDAAGVVQWIHVGNENSEKGLTFGQIGTDISRQVYSSCVASAKLGVIICLCGHAREQPLVVIDGSRVNIRWDPTARGPSRVEPRTLDFHPKDYSQLLLA